MRSSLLIIGLGQNLDVNYGSEYYPSYGRKDYTKSPVENLIENLDNNNWHIGTSLFIENYKLFDSRSYNTKINKFFCYKVKEGLEKGANIVIIARHSSHVDKRLREIAQIIDLPEVKLNGTNKRPS